MLELYHAEPVANSTKFQVGSNDEPLGFVNEYLDLPTFHNLPARPCQANMRRA